MVLSMAFSMTWVWHNDSLVVVTRWSLQDQLDSLALMGKISRRAGKIAKQYKYKETGSRQYGPNSTSSRHLLYSVVCRE